MRALRLELDYHFSYFVNVDWAEERVRFIEAYFLYSAKDCKVGELASLSRVRLNITSGGFAWVTLLTFVSQGAHICNIRSIIIEENQG